MKILYIPLIYLLLINIIAFIAMGADKSRARRHLRRIPEATLLLFAVIGGSVGALCGMYLFRHKTRHAAFSVGLPLILLAHIVLALLLFCKLTLN